jgi:putative DNA primase/helicase
MTAVDYYAAERSFLEFSESQGIGISETPALNGKIHRFRLETDRHGERSGAYCVWPEGKNYDGKPHGWLQDHHEGGGKHFWQFYGRDNPPPRKELTDSERDEARARREAEQRQELGRRREALESAWGIYQAAKAIEESPDHPYLLEKRVRPAGPLRVGSVPSKSGKLIGGVLLIPCFDVLSGEFVALHRVFPWRDRESGKFSKGWYPGTCGSVLPVAGDVQRGPLFVAEGITTALSTYDAWIEEGEPEAPGEYVPCCAVLACMDSGNLARQARGIRQKYASRRLLAVRDSDDAGEKAARAAIDAGFDGVVDAPGER